MIIKLSEQEWNTNKSVLRETVKQKLNGNTPDNLVFEASKKGEEVEINLKI